MSDSRASGSIWLLYLFDICDEIRLEQLGPAPPQPSFRHPSPDYVRFEKPPVAQPIDDVKLESGELLTGRLNYYEYGVASLELEMHFDCEWERLPRLASRWIEAPDLERAAETIVRRHVETVREALEKPYPTWLSEDYCVIHVHTQPGCTAPMLLATRGAAIAQIVRGETAELSSDEQTEILAARLSYYPMDLLVVGWTAAFVYDTPEGAAPTLQLLQYANTQLLDFRHYDEVLTHVLADAHRAIEGRRGVFWRWRLVGEAERLNAIRLDIREITERMDNSIKFLSDMFSARLYRLSALRIGVPDYRTLVDEKLRTAGELYDSLVDEFQHARAFLLELIVVIILVIELVFLFRGIH